MRLRRTALAAVLAATLGGVTALAGCGNDGPVADPGPSTTPPTNDPYRLTVRSSQGATDAIDTSICGKPDSELVELPCGVSLGFARTSASRLYVGKNYERIFLDLERPASAIFTSLGQGIGDRGLERRSSLVKLADTGRRASIGYGPSTADLPTVAEPTYLSVLVIFEHEMPVPQPAAAGVPKDAVVQGATAEYLVQLATRSAAEDDNK